MAIIDDALVTDAAEILALQRAAFYSDVERYHDPDIPPMLQTVEDTVRELSSMRCWKAVEDGRIVGSIRARDTGGLIEFFKLMILPDHWGKGLGSELLVAAEAAFSHAHTFRLFTGGLNYDNQRFYIRRGYRIIGRRQITPTVFVFDLEKPGLNVCAGEIVEHAARAAQSVKILPASITDTEAILALQRLAFYQEAVLFDDLHMQPLTQTASEITDEIAKARVWKAVTADGVVGSVRVRQAPDGGVEIFKLIVHPALWGGGLGRRLLQTAEETFADAKVFRLYTAERNTMNVTFYRTHGYRPVGTHAVSPTLRMIDLQKSL